MRAGTLRVPRRWEQLLVDAAVVGGLDRWRRRLDGLAGELRLRLDGLDEAEQDEPRARAIRRDLADLEHLRSYGLPLLEALSRLPDGAEWGVWLDALAALATRALRHPARVLSVLAELAPMAPVGPVGVPEVLRVLSPRLLEIADRPAGTRYGMVFVAPIDAARGRAFDVAFVPGLAERVFPPKITEDPILLDEVRERLNAASTGASPVNAASTAGPPINAGSTAGPPINAGSTPFPAPLVTNDDRVAAERLALRLAVGAATKRVVLSYPRLEMIKTRPRVPSFYALEAARAAEGRLPRFEELAARAEQVADARIGWPAPERADDAIDDAEYDLAVLDDLDERGLRGEAAVKAAGHLLHTNPHLARALRFRAYRWNVPKWTGADGLVNPAGPARAALDRHRVDARPFSATALQHFAACPYRFFLHAVHGLAPREAPVGIEAL
ncbi:MAG: PD-(D/E)XK nuclease family protein, partial [Gemmatimonadota bacterium]